MADEEEKKDDVAETEAGENNAEATTEQDGATQVVAEASAVEKIEQMLKSRNSASKLFGNGWLRSIPRMRLPKDGLSGWTCITELNLP